MSQTVLNPPLYTNSPFNTGDGAELGDTPKEMIDKLNTMFTELYDDTPYIVGNWYLPGGIRSVSGGANGGIGTVRTHPAIIRRPCTISDLGVRVTSAVAGNVQAAIYANNPLTGRPTGAPLVATESMSTAAATVVTSAAALEIDTPGLYWFAVCVDTTGAVLNAISNSMGSGMSDLIGSATPTNAMSATGGLSGLAVTGTFGTWPDMTAASFTESVGSSGYGAVQFKIG